MLESAVNNWMAIWLSWKARLKTMLFNVSLTVKLLKLVKYRGEAFEM